jgi:predicted nuclease of predicted toxin-antitoxin system
MIWVDVHLSPALARWIKAEFDVPAVALRDLSLQRSKDRQIFVAAREARAIVLTKDSDFAELVQVFGPPPHILWITCGNTSNSALQLILRKALPQALEMIKRGEPLVEITGAPQ